MDLEFADDELLELYTDPTFTAGLGVALVKAFRKRMQQISAAPDERTFYGLKSMHFEKLKGERSGECSMKLNDQYRLIIKFVTAERGKRVRVIEITDYH